MAYDELQDVTDTRRSFPTTDWGMIEHIRAHDDGDRALINLLLRRYWRPVYCYLRRKGYPHEDAKDLTQGFFHDVVLNHHLVERADSSKGRFRSFLLHALNQYSLNEKAKKSAQRRIPQDHLISLETVNPNALPTSVRRLPANDLYHYVWVSTLLDAVLANVKEACCSDGLKLHWEVFNARVVQPILANRKPPPLKEICRKFGIQNTATASNMAITIKRRFRAALREYIHSTISNGGQIDAEIEDLIRLLPKEDITRLLSEGAQDSH